jgi:hypothetical protein
MCEDFARLGFDRVVVDAGVQVAYNWDMAKEMMAGEHPGPYKLKSSPCVL